MSAPPLAAPTFHRAARAAVEAEEPALWAWFASDRFDEEQRRNGRDLSCASSSP